MEVLDVTKHNYQELIDIWEAAVRTTHDFLPEKNINELKPLILEHCFDAVDLRCVKKAGQICSFIGVSESNIEMLIVKPEYFGTGIGRSLIE